MQDGDNVSQSLRYIRHSVVFNGDNMKMMHHVCTLSKEGLSKNVGKIQSIHSTSYKHNDIENSQEGIHYLLSALTISLLFTRHSYPTNCNHALIESAPVPDTMESPLLIDQLEIIQTIHRDLAPEQLRQHSSDCNFFQTHGHCIETIALEIISEPSHALLYILS